MSRHNIGGHHAVLPPGGQRPRGLTRHTQRLLLYAARTVARNFSTSILR